MPPDDLATVMLSGNGPGPFVAGESCSMEPGVAAVLRAVAAMARVSKRQQAELVAALQRAGLMLSPGDQRSALRHLCESGSVEGVIPLDDGGVLLSVTSAGMERASRW